MTYSTKTWSNRDVIGWRQSKSTGETLREKVLVRQFTQANIGLLAGNHPALDTTSADNDIEMQGEAEEKKLHWMAKVYDIVEMWQDMENLWATQKESCGHNEQMTAVGYISDTAEIVKASMSNFQHDVAAAFKLSEKSPGPPALSAKDLAGGRTEVLIVWRIKRIDHHPANSDENCSPESISDTKTWLNWSGNLDNPNNNKDDWEADHESEMLLDNGHEDSETPEQQNVSAVPNIPGLIQPIRGLKKMAAKVSMMVNIMGTMRNTGIKKK